MRRQLFFIILGLSTSAPSSVLAQSTGGDGAGRAGPRLLLPPEREIALARSAAPAAVTDSATVYVLREAGYAVAVRGSSGVACYVGRSWPGSLEPHCFDAEGAATILPIEMRRTELLARGVPYETVQRQIADGLLHGRYRMPQRPALSWMMSSAQQLIDDDGKPAGAWRPHLMIYYPYLTAASLGLGPAPDPRQAMLVDGGTPEANLTIIVGSAVPPADTSRGR
jgi:hypothetical protein